MYYKFDTKLVIIGETHKYVVIIIFLFNIFALRVYPQKGVDKHVENGVDKVYLIHTT